MRTQKTTQKSHDWQLRLPPPTALFSVRHISYLGPLVDEVLDGRDRRADTGVIGDGGPVERYVEVAAHEHPASFARVPSSCRSSVSFLEAEVIW